MPSVLRTLSATLLVSLLISACSLTDPQSHLIPTPPTVPLAQRLQVWKKQRALILASPYFYQNSRIGITTDTDSATATLDWTYSDPHHYQLELADPLSFGDLILTKNNHHTVIHYNQEYFEGDHPQALIQRLTQLRLPIEPLQYWIRGLPDPQFPIEEHELNTQGLSESFRQQDWRLRYTAYQSLPSPHRPGLAVYLPGVITLQGPHLAIKIKINRWALSPTKID